MGRDNDFIAQYRLARNISRIFASDSARECAEAISEVDLKDREASLGLNATCEALADMEALATDEDILKLLDGYEKLRLSTPAVSTSGFLKFKKVRFFSLAASVLVAAVMLYAIFWFEGVEKATMDRYVTRIGEQKQITLSDGSSVHLNTGTELLVDMSDRARRLLLLRGEAFFDVARDENRNFTVVLEDRAISVLGTEFNIQKMSDGFVLSVAEGEVAVHPVAELAMKNAPLVVDGVSQDKTDAAHRRVRSGWIVDFKGDDATLVARQGSIAAMSGWRTGIINFVDVPLVTVVKELNRYSAKKIIIEDAAVMNRPVSASIRIDSIQATLKALAAGFSLEIVHNFDYIVIVGKDKK